MKEQLLRFHIFFLWIFHIGLVSIVGLLIYHTFPNRFFGDLPINFIPWDAEWYFTIAKDGYKKYSSTAFFPGFPLLWKLIPISGFFMGIVNAIISGVAFQWYLAKKGLSSFQLLKLFAVPSFLFFFVPYSESFFLLLIVGYFISIEKRNFWWIFLFICLASFTRSSINILLPSLLIASLMLNNSENWKIFGTSLLGMMAGLGLCVLYQFQSSGEWFTFFEAQKLWGHHFQMPTLPFNTWETTTNNSGMPSVLGNTMMLDSLAFFLGGLVSILVLVYFLQKKLNLFKNVKSEFFIKSELNYIQLLSMMMIIGSFLFSIFFKGGSLFSLNRYLFTNLFYVEVYLLFQKSPLNKKKWIIILSTSALIFSLAFLKSYTKLVDVLTYFLIIYMWISLITVPKLESKKFNQLLNIFSYLILMIFQGWFLVRFLTFHWVA